MRSRSVAGDGLDLPRIISVSNSHLSYNQDIFARNGIQDLLSKKKKLRDLVCINQNATLEESFSLLANSDGIAVVTDNKAHPTGVVTSKAVLNVMARS